MDSHDHYLELAAAPQDVSLPVFEELIGGGYMTGVWMTDPGATDGPCIAADGNTYTLPEFISGLQHAAPFYEHTHVGCKCALRCQGPGLPDVVVTAFGRQS